MPVNITSYGKNKDGNGSGNGTVYKSVVTRHDERYESADRLAKTHNIWGHPFNGTQDVDGDFTAQGNWVVTNPDDASQGVRFKHSGASAITNGRFIGRKTDFEIHDGHLQLSDSSSKEKLLIGKDYIKTNGSLTIHADNDLALEAHSMTQKYEEGHLDLGIKGDLKVGTTYTNNIYDDGGGQVYVGSPLILDGGLTLNGDLTVKDMFSQNTTNDQEIRTKDLTVTGAATFFNLIIADIQAVGGQIILSAADFRVDAVEQGRTDVPNPHQFSVIGNGMIDGKYRTKYIYQLAADAEGQKVECKWKPYDQIISYTANVTEDSSLEARSWWTLVLDVQSEVEHMIGGEVKLCHRLEIVDGIIDSTYSDGTPANNDTWANPSWGAVNPLEGDNCALLGSWDPYRQNAIILAAYNTIDLRLKAPCIAQYTNICGFELPEAITYFSPSGNRITGSLIANSGKNYTDVIDSLLKGRQTYMHRAWSDSEDGTLNFTKTKDRDYEFEGLCSNMNPSDSELTYSDYLWMRAGETNKLLPTRERLYLSDNDNLYLDVEYLMQGWTARHNITAEIYTYGGAVTTRQINDITADQKRMRYAGVVQQGWSGITDHSMQYCGATIYLKDALGNILDARSIQLTMDAGAILSITDSIRARVSDAEGNIASIVMTSHQILTRISSIEQSLQFVLTDDSAELRLDDIEGRLNQIRVDINGLIARIEGAEEEIQDEYDDNWIRKRFAEFEATIDGLKATLQSVQTNGYDDTWVKTKFSTVDVSIDGLYTKVSEVETKGYDDDWIVEKFSEISNTVDGLSVRVGNIETYGDDSSATDSELAVMANKVYMRVSNNLLQSGIDVEAGRITISSQNTDIVGDLNLYNSGTGFSVFSPDKTKSVQLRNDSLGVLDKYNLDGYVAYPYNIEGSKGQTGGQTPFIITMPTKELGNFNSGDTITLNANLYGFDPGDKLSFFTSGTGNDYQGVTKIEWTFQLTDAAGNVLKQNTGSFDVPPATTRSWMGWTLEGVSDFTTTYTGTHKAKCEIRCYTSHQGNDAMSYTAYTDYSGYIKMNAISKLSIDGMVISQSNQEYIWFGQKKLKGRYGGDYAFIVRNKQQNFKVDPLGIYRSFHDGYAYGDSYFANNICKENDDAMWGDITSTLPVAQPFISEYSENVYTPSFSVGLLSPRSISSATKSITYKLPEPSGCPGKVYYIKNCIPGAQDYKVTCEGASNTNKKMML